MCADCLLLPLQRLGATAGDASVASSLLPLAGMVSIVLCGVAVDKVPRHRGVVMPAVVTVLLIGVAVMALHRNVR